jgi:hypothetical protein
MPKKTSLTKGGVHRGLCLSEQSNRRCLPQSAHVEGEFILGAGGERN